MYVESYQQKLEDEEDANDQLLSEIQDMKSNLKAKEKEITQVKELLADKESEILLLKATKPEPGLKKKYLELEKFCKERLGFPQGDSKTDSLSKAGPEKHFMDAFKGRKLTK